MADDDEYEALFNYLQWNEYPTGFSKSQNRALRRKASTNYKAENGILFYSILKKTVVSASGSKFLALFKTGIEYWRLATHYLKVIN